MKDNSVHPISSQVKLSYNGNDFLLDIAEGNMISLNAIYEIAGKPKTKDPRRWFDTEQGRQLVETLIKKLNVAKNDIIKTSRGKGGGTWAHWQLAAEYAAYLGGAEVRLSFINSVRELSLILKALSDFEISQDVLDACEEILYVYAIREVNTGHIKLGISKDPQTRLKQLQTGNSSRLELVAYCEAKQGFRDERASHEENADYHIHGEWFTAEVKLIKMN